MNTKPTCPASARRFGQKVSRALLAAAVLVALSFQPTFAQYSGENSIDTALILAVDTSQSVNEERFRLQMDGIAAALEDPGVINTILGGPRGAIAIMLVSWADHSYFVLPWTAIRSKQDAIEAAARIRNLPRRGGEYTCMARMLRNLKETVIDSVPFNPLKTVIDISGSLDTIFGDQHLVAVAREKVTDRRPNDRAVVCHEYAHQSCSPARDATSRLSRERSVWASAPCRRSYLLRYALTPADHARSWSA